MRLFLLPTKFFTAHVTCAQFDRLDASLELRIILTINLKPVCAFVISFSLIKKFSVIY